LPTRFPSEFAKKYIFKVAVYPKIFPSVKRITYGYDILLYDFCSNFLIFARMKEKIFDKVVELISSNNHIPPETIKMDSSFEDLGMDSLDGLTLINDLENEYNITLPNEEVVKIKSVRQAVDNLDKVLTSTNHE
jgi:acyl carrier protein